MNVRLWFFSSGFCVVLILRLAPLAESGAVQSFIAGVAAGEFWRKYANDPLDARYTKNFGAELKVTMGDVVVTSVFPTSKTVMRPWHWFFTLWPARAGPEGKPIPAKMIRFLPTRRTLFESVNPQLFNPAIKYQTRVLMNREKKPGHIGLVGVLIAYMMAQTQKLYFNPFFCSAKHYVEYLSLGQVTGGRWWQPLYNRLSKRCPVRKLVTPEMLDEIYRKKTFTLKGKLEDARVTLRVDEWPEEIQLLYQKHKENEI